MLSIILIISLFYIIVISLINFGWLNLKPFISNSSNLSTVYISVIIAFRDEEEKLDFIIEDILSQELEGKNFELILVNDHSRDNSYFVAKRYSENNINIKLIELEEKEGKKYAIDYGIKHAKGKIIVTTDADCRVGQSWLKIISEYYLQTNAKMIVCPVLYQTTRKIFTFKNFQALEFLSLTSSTAGSLGLNRPIMCNGANLVFEKKVYLEFSDPTNIQHVSGDDTFLLFNILKKYPKGISYLKSAEATAYTEASGNIQEFFNQRLRWASKTKYYSNFFVLFVGIVTFLINIVILTSFLLMIFNIFPIRYFFIPFIFKFVIDFILLLQSSIFFSGTKLLILYVPLQLIYSLYVCVIGFLSFFFKYSWKGRKVI